eukprot:173132_1
MLCKPASYRGRCRRMLRLQFRNFRMGSKTPATTTHSKKCDVVIIGGGHNGLVAASYLSGKKRFKVLVLERRHIVGGAAVTEEIVPGFKFSRASYLAGLLRPDIIDELNLEEHGLKFLPRDPYSFTPREDGAYLMLGSDEEKNKMEIAKFSALDALAFPVYEQWLSEVRNIIPFLLDNEPLTLSRWPGFSKCRELFQLGKSHPESFQSLCELLMSPASKILDRHFESDILKTTLATDAVIGAITSPSQPGSAYVLLHHVMGNINGNEGSWAYVEGGMGALSNSLSQAATKAGAEIRTNAAVKRILVDEKKSAVTGVELESGERIEAKIVLSNCTPQRTFVEFLPSFEWSKLAHPKSEEFINEIRNIDYRGGSFKINCATKELPNFKCLPNDPNGYPGPQHMGTIHFESRMEQIEEAFAYANTGRPASRPVIEMTIPSSVDTTISPDGQHVCQLFVQFAPYDLKPSVGSWKDKAFKEKFVRRVFSIVDKFCPNFSSSIIGYDALSPLDLETIFGLHRGNIFHGAMSPSQIAHFRPSKGFSDYRTPIRGLYLCGAGAHPGGGVMGAPGRNCARAVFHDH